jgi:HK97 family phage prohead protease
MPPTVERRYTRQLGPVRLEQRADGSPPVITGYAAVFYDANDPGTEYRLYDDLVERIMPGAFTRALSDDDVRALFNHDANHVLGRTLAGTCRLSVDAKGLRYEVDPPDTQTARDLVASIRRGDITGSSFGFVPRSTTYRKDDAGGYVLERNDVQLFDVSPVTFPAYASTQAGVRAGGDADTVRREVEAWERSQAKPASRDAVRARAAAVAATMAD